VERHGGTITADDNPAGHGSRLSFTLPPAVPVRPDLAPAPH
jgi:signal transduction histidine kinase